MDVGTINACMYSLCCRMINKSISQWEKESTRVHRVHHICIDNTWTMNLGSVETSTTQTREQKLQEQQAGTILWTSIDQPRTLGTYGEQEEEDQYELYYIRMDNIKPTAEIVKNHAYLLTACPPWALFRLNPFIIYKILYIRTHF